MVSTTLTQENAGINDQLQQDAATRNFRRIIFGQKKRKSKKYIKGEAKKMVKKAKKSSRIKLNRMGYLHNEIETQNNLKNLELEFIIIIYLNLI